MFASPVVGEVGPRLSRVVALVAVRFGQNRERSPGSSPGPSPPGWNGLPVNSTGMEVSVWSAFVMRIVQVLVGPG